MSWVLTLLKNIELFHTNLIGSTTKGITEKIIIGNHENKRHAKNCTLHTHIQWSILYIYGPSSIPYIVYVYIVIIVR